LHNGKPIPSRRKLVGVIEAYLPSRIANLFFLTASRSRNWRSRERGSHAQGAIHSLLGLIWSTGSTRTFSLRAA
jgi:hypothetical protein